MALVVLAQGVDGAPAGVADAALYAAARQRAGPVGVDPVLTYADGVFPAVFVVDAELRV